MAGYQIAAAVAVVGVAWLLRNVFRTVISNIFPQALPGEENTSRLATERPTSTGILTAKDLEGVVEYDYIIIGAGTSGCVLANRLSADSKLTVLAIESGHSDLKQIMSRMPAGIMNLMETSIDWAFKTTPQVKSAGRKINWPRGKAIGGCSSVNAMMYTRGAPADYDEWERLGITGWSYKDLVPYFKRAERFRQPNEPRRRLSYEVEKQHGTDGPWEIGYTDQSEINAIFPDGCDEIGITKIEDINTDKGTLGAAHTQMFIDGKGQRASTAVAYLTADVVKRPNLKIASGQNVTRIIFDTSGRQPRAVGVEMVASGSANVRYVVKAKKEVILAGGAIGSPQLLKLSGIGPAQELQAHNIPVIKDLPGVGENLMDHTAYEAVTFKTNMEASLHRLRSPLKGLSALIQWFCYGTGPLTGQGCDSVAFIRSADRDDILPSLKGHDYTSGPAGADLELIAVAACIADHGKFVAPLTDGYGSIFSVCLRPQSRGTVKLASNDPFEPPLIDPNMFAEEYDIDIILYGIKLALKVVKSKTYEKYFKGWYNGPHHPLDWETATDDEIKNHIREAAETLYHPMGTAKMGRDENAVVDDQLRVHGVQGLRVVDASVFPTPLACHTCAPVVVLAEKAADLIKEAA